MSRVCCDIPLFSSDTLFPQHPVSMISQEPNNICFVAFCCGGILTGFTHNLLALVTGIMAIMQLAQWQWSNPVEKSVNKTHESSANDNLTTTQQRTAHHVHV